MWRRTRRDFCVALFWGIVLFSGVYCCKTTTQSGQNPAQGGEKSCSAYPSSADCAAHKQCSWDSSTGCFMNQNCASYAPDAQSCARYADCLWDQIHNQCTNTSVKNCVSYTTATACPVSCLWTNGSCQLPTTTGGSIVCSRYSDAASCGTYAAVCGWVAAAPAGTVTGSCLNLPIGCQSYLTANDCHLHSALCLWNGTVCVTGSATPANAVTPVAQTGAVSPAICTDKSSWLSCLFASGCQWVQSACTPK